ncbi:MAG: hypothetical protein PHC88_05540 [Terrimicrobiaceae bacterium]|nr:hypothetical protein [Terrimicrobiaceae bacterium]
MFDDKYRRDGTKYPPGMEGVLEWGRDFEDREKKIVRQDELPNGYWVSTVWIGINYRYGDGPPLIFETMVFDSRNGDAADYQERYSTEDDAIIGHLKAVDHFATYAKSESSNGQSACSPPGAQI